MDGVLVIDKEEGFTSFDVVAVLRRLCNQRKIGHTGTLDPMATGVLVLLIGRATKAADLLPDTEKEYLAGCRFGIATDTQDSTGRVIREDQKPVSETDLARALVSFQGTIAQIPPMFSAVSVNGRRLYDLARQGHVIDRKARPVTISTLQLISYDAVHRSGVLRVVCSGGTYIRTLCADIGEALGSCAVMTSLRRIRACGYCLTDAITLREAKELSAAGKLQEQLQPTDALFALYEKIAVTQAQAVRFANGGALALNRLALRQVQEGLLMRVYAPDGTFLGLGKVKSGDLMVCKLFGWER